MDRLRESPLGLSGTRCHCHPSRSITHFSGEGAMSVTIAGKLSKGFKFIIGLIAVGSCFTFWQMAQIIHTQKVTECRTQEMKASYEILAAISQINGALRGYIIARLNNDPD